MRFQLNLWLPAILLCAIAGCFRESSEVREAKLQDLVAVAIEAQDNCAAADALLNLASHYESREKWIDALGAAQRGIDVWEPAEVLAFLIRERERSRAAGYPDSVEEYDRKIEEAKDRLKLWIPPKDEDPACHLRPPAIDLVGARLLAARVALKASNRAEARAQLDALRGALSAHRPIYATVEQERELERLEKLCQDGADAA